MLIDTLRTFFITVAWLCSLAAGAHGAAAELDALPMLVTHRAYSQAASASLPIGLPFGVIYEGHHLTLIDRATGRPLRHVEFPNEIRTVVVAHDGSAMLVNILPESQSSVGLHSVWQVATRDGTATPAKLGVFEERWVDIISGNEGWFVARGFMSRQSRLCQLRGLSSAKGLDIACGKDFVGPGSGFKPKGLVFDPSRTRAYLAMGDGSTVVLMQLPPQGTPAQEIGRLAATELLGAEPLKMQLSDNGARMHLLVRALGAPGESGVWLQSWRLEGVAAQLEASRQVAMRTMMLGLSLESGTLSVLEAGWLSRDPIVRVEVDPRTLLDANDRARAAVPSSEGAIVVGGNADGDWLMVRRSGATTIMGNGREPLEMAVFPVESTRWGWESVAIHSSGIHLARGKESALSVDLDPAAQPIVREAVPNAATIHAVHPRWIAAARYDPGDNTCCLSIIDRQSGKTKYDLKVPGITTLSPRLAASFAVAFSANGRFLAARDAGLSGRKDSWVLLSLDDGRVIRYSDYRELSAGKQFVVTDEGQILDVRDTGSVLLTPLPDGSGFSLRPLLIGPGRVQLLGDKIVHELRSPAGGVSLGVSALSAPMTTDRIVYEHRHRLESWALSPDGQQIAYVEQDGSLRVRSTKPFGQTVLSEFDQSVGFDCFLPDGRIRFIKYENGQPVALVERRALAPEVRLPLPASVLSGTAVQYDCSPRYGTGFLLSSRHGRVDVWRHEDPRSSTGFIHLGHVAGVQDIPMPCSLRDITAQGRQVFIRCLHGPFDQVRGVHDEVVELHAFPESPPLTAGIGLLHRMDGVFLSDDLEHGALMRRAPRDDVMPTVEWFNAAHPTVGLKKSNLRPTRLSLLMLAGAVASPSRGIVLVASAHLSRLDFWHRGEHAPRTAYWTRSGTREMREALYVGAFTADERHYVACVDGRAVAFDTHSATLVFELDLNTAIARSSCTVVAATALDNVIIVHNGLLKRLQLRPTSDSTIETVLAGPGSHPHEIGYLQNGRLLVSVHDDGFLRFWDPREGRLLVALLAGSTGWVAVAPDGRFDVSDFDVGLPLSWVLPDQPFKALPLEAFMKDYYEPRLLARILAGETFKPVRTLTSLNRTQPEVKIVSVVPEGADPSLVRVTVFAAGATKSYLQGEGASSKEVPRPTAVHDLRLFREGQVVGYADGKLAEFSPSGFAFTKIFTVRLPRAKSGQDVVFTAYAFNDDRVKSETVRSTYKAPALPSAVASTQGRAYVISMGVNQHENNAWNLGYAANDARAVAQRVSADLRKSAQYAEVVPLVLASDGEKQQASKAALRAVLARLAGQPASPADESALQGVAGAEQLRKAQPDDLVLISFAGHGFADDAGQFYLLPQDTGDGSSKQITEALKARSISSEELSLWLRDVDAGDMTMIVDACQSAASVQAEGFKPGPMGSRGLGQLSFDKGMRILAASQSDEFALEDQRLRHGLLTFSLINDGLEAFNADFEPKDSKVWLDEWLRYGLKRVPALADEVKSGTVKVANRGPERGAVRVNVPEASGKPSAAARPAQQPALFDFARKRQTVVLASP